MKSPVTPLKSFLQEQQILDSQTTMSIHIKLSADKESFILSTKPERSTPLMYKMSDFTQLQSKLRPLKNIVENQSILTQLGLEKVEFHNNKVVTTFHIDHSDALKNSITKLLQQNLAESPSITPVKLHPEDDGTLHVKIKDSDSIRFYNLPSETTTNSMIRKLIYQSLKTNYSVSLATNPYMFHYFEDELRIYTENQYQNCTDISLQPYFQTLPEEHLKNYQDNSS